MLVYILLAFIMIPAIELVLLIYLFRFSGWEFSLGLIVFTGVLGSFLAKRQGWQTWARIKQDLAEGRVPTTDLMHGLFILIAGALLLTPGILTDITGFLLLVPAVRLMAGTVVMKRLRSGLSSGTISFQHVSMNSGQSRGSEGEGDDIIDVEAKVTPDEPEELDR